jgi:hypothetical protein
MFITAKKKNVTKKPNHFHASPSQSHHPAADAKAIERLAGFRQENNRIPSPLPLPIPAFKNQNPCSPGFRSPSSPCLLPGSLPRRSHHAAAASPAPRWRWPLFLIGAGAAVAGVPGAHGDPIRRYPRAHRHQGRPPRYARYEWHPPLLSAPAWAPNLMWGVQMWKDSAGAAGRRPRGCRWIGSQTRVPRRT